MIDRPWVFMCAGGESIGSLIKTIQKNNPQKPIYGMDANININSMHKKLFNKFFIIPMPHEDKFFPNLITILKKIGPCLLIPGSDEEALVLSKYKNILDKKNILCNVMPNKIISKIINKYDLSKNITNLNSDFITDLEMINNNAGFKKACIDMGYPNEKLILKPIIGRGRRSTFIISEAPFENKIKDIVPTINLDVAIKNKLIKNDTMMLMRYIEGEAITVDVLANQGKIIKTVIRKWNEKWRSPFPGQKIILNRNIDELIKTIIKIIPLHGLVDIDIIKTKDGRVKFLEVNPRPSGSVAVSEIAGIPIFSILEKILEGKDIDKINFKNDKIINEI